MTDLHTKKATKIAKRWTKGLFENRPAGNQEYLEFIKCLEQETIKNLADRFRAKALSETAQNSAPKAKPGLV